MRRGGATESERSAGTISRVAVVLAALVGLFAGGLGAGALQRTPVVEDPSFAAGGDDAAPLPTAPDGVLLAWTPDRLPATLEWEIASALRDVAGSEAERIAVLGEQFGIHLSDALPWAQPLPADRMTFPA